METLGRGNLVRVRGHDSWQRWMETAQITDARLYQMSIALAAGVAPDIGWLGIVAWLLMVWYPFLRFIHTDWVYERWKMRLGPPIRPLRETIIDAVAYALFIALLAVDRIIRHRPIRWWWALFAGLCWLLIVVILYVAYRSGAIFLARTARDEERFRERWLRQREERQPETHDGGQPTGHDRR